MDSAGGSFGFECSTCGAYHVGMPSFGWDWPIQYLTVPETDRDRRTELPDYCIKAALHIRPWPSRPYIELEPTDYPLAVEQREGISSVRVRQIAERVMHMSRTRHGDAAV